MSEKEQTESPFELVTACLAASALLYSFSSAVVVLRFQIRAARSPSRLRRLLGLNSLWPVRLLVVLFASLICFSELLHLRVLRRCLPRPVSSSLCTAHSLLSPSFAEPAFFSTLLFLLRGSTHPKPPHSSVAATASTFLSASAYALSVSLPFLLLHAAFLSLPDSLFLRLGLPADFLGHAHRRRCSVPLFATVLLALLAAVYVPLFVSACWSVVAVVINKRLRTRLYTLTASVVASLSVQVAALAFASLWPPSSAVSQGLSLVAFVSVLVSIVAGEAILVLQPVVDSLAVFVDPVTGHRRSGDDGSRPAQDIGGV
ncbi:hypothetical protein HPP92_000438 [Vanilla planifolia]|uniref:Uncharacterized protein n=1 Tax=Vanilla planifolia TaxID=51239 RepID=A0A835VKW5_VANPL|nr:hypothetical protein HPP92_000438 [Vanilla planifolia]